MKKIWVIWIGALLLAGCAKQLKVSQSTNSLVYILSDNMFYQLESEGCRLNIQVEPSDSLQYNSDMKELPKLVFFHTQLNCNLCVEHISSTLNRYRDILSPDNCLYFAAYSNKRDLTLFKRTHQPQQYVYNIQSVGLPLEKFNIPFCFVLNEDRKAECVYIPLENDTTLFKKYLKLVNAKYFEK